MLLTNDKLLHLLPLYIISCFMSNGNSDPSLYALGSQRRIQNKGGCFSNEGEIITINICIWEGKT